MLLRRTLWDLPWTPDFVALEPEQRMFVVRTLAASDEEFRKLKPTVQEFTIAQLLIPISPTRATRFLRALRILGRRLLWLGESWTERQRREQAESVREFTVCVIDRNTDRPEETRGVGSLDSEGTAGGTYGNRKAAEATAAGDPTDERLDSINAGGTVH